MKKWMIAGAALLAAAVFSLIFFLFPGNRSQHQLSLWYVSGDYSPAVMELLAQVYNDQREKEDYPLAVRAFATEDELAAAFEQSQPDLLMCSYVRAASLGSREQLAAIDGLDYSYLTAIEDALPYAGHSFFPLGSSVPVLAYNKALLAGAGITPEFVSLEALCAAAGSYYEKTGSPFFTAQTAAPLLAVWSSSLGYELCGNLDRDSLSEHFCRVYNLLAQCAYNGSFLPLSEDAPQMVEVGLLPCALISSVQAAQLSDGCGLAPLPLPKGGSAVYVPELMGLAITGANTHALPSARAFLSWLNAALSSGSLALSMALVPAGEEVSCTADADLAALLMDMYRDCEPRLYSPLGDYAEAQPEFESQLCRTLDLLY